MGYPQTTPTAGNDLTSLVENARFLGAAMAEQNKDEVIHYALVPAGMALESLEDYQWPDGRVPERITASVRMSDTSSFVKYVQSFADERTRVFANPKDLNFRAVLDYHVAGDRKPEFLRHNAMFALEQDERWKTWSGSDGRWFSQIDFAEFIEDNYQDIDTPPAAAMLEVARDLHAKNDVAFDSRVSLKDGQVQMTYQETIKATVGTGAIEVPESFKIRIPVFFGEHPVLLDVRLRFRISNQKVVFAYKMYNRTSTLLNAFRATTDAIASDLKLDVLMGTVVPA